MILVRKVKLQPTAEQAAILLETLKQYKQAIDLPLQFGFQHKQISGVELHKATYYELRKSTQLPSQLVCSARCKAAEALKAIKTKTKGKFDTKQPQSRKFPTVRLDRNSCGITATSVKITTINGRIAIPLIRYPFADADWENIGTTCELQYKPYKDEWYLNVFVEKPEPTPKKNGTVLGIDRGCKHIAVLSNNQFHDSKHLRNVKSKYKYLRRRLQGKGTKSAIKLLKKISGKDNRFVRDTNHCISKQIVALPFDTFVLEKLNIKKEKKLGRKFNSILAGWSWFQLETFLKYKSVLAGKSVEYVDARYTSQKCSCCGHIERANRQGINFSCKQCGFRLHSDLNASRNIKNNYIAALGTSLGSRSLSTDHTLQPVQISGS
jgi:putative transposase